MLHVISPFQIIRQKNLLQKEVKHSKCFTCFELIQYTLPLTLVCPSHTYFSGDNIHFSCFALAGSISSNKSWLDSWVDISQTCCLSFQEFSNRDGLLSETTLQTKTNLPEKARHGKKRTIIPISLMKKRKCWSLTSQYSLVSTYKIPSDYLTSFWIGKTDSPLYSVTPARLISVFKSNSVPHFQGGIFKNSFYSQTMLTRLNGFRKVSHVIIFCSFWYI